MPTTLTHKDLARICFALWGNNHTRTESALKQNFWKLFSASFLRELIKRLVNGNYHGVRASWPTPEHVFSQTLFSGMDDREVAKAKAQLQRMLQNKTLLTPPFNTL